MAVEDPHSVDPIRVRDSRDPETATVTSDLDLDQATVATRSTAAFPSQVEMVRDRDREDSTHTTVAIAEAVKCLLAQAACEIEVVHSEAKEEDGVDIMERAEWASSSHS